MSTNPQNNKRITKQIRISLDIHRKLKLKAVNQNTTISKLADHIIGNFINNNNTQDYDNKKYTEKN